MVNALDGLADYLLVLGDSHGAIDALHEALKLTAIPYPQGRALVLNGLGRVAAARQHWNTAWLRFRQADLVWHFLDQPLSAATSERGLAECAHHLRDRIQVVPAGEEDVPPGHVTTNADKIPSSTATSATRSR